MPLQPTDTLHASQRLSLWPKTPSSGGLSAEAIAAVRSGQVPLVLIIDDSTTVRSILGISCRRAGLPAAIFPDALQAFEALARQVLPLPDVVVLDVHLPRLDGYQAARLLRRNPGMRHIPIIMLSGETSIWAKLRSRWAGADAYLTKPFNAARLTQQLRLLLGIASNVS